MKKLIMTLMLVFTLSFVASTTVEAKTTTITVKKANVSTARKLDKQLLKGKKFYVRVAGNKTKSKALLNKVNDKLEAVNEMGVRMQFSSPKKQGKYTRYTVSADKAKSYKYAIVLIKDIRTRYLAGELDCGILDKDYGVLGLTEEEELEILRFLNQTDYQKCFLVHRGKSIPNWALSEN